MAKLVYGLNQSLDGYVDHDHPAFVPDPVLFHHFIERTRDTSGMIYGSRMYNIMRYWDEEQSDWGDTEREYAEAWRSTPKWIVSRSLKSVGPNASLISDDLEATIRGLKKDLDGEIETAGPELAGSLSKLGLIDEYQIYLLPVVTGSGKPFFTVTPPPLRLVSSDRIGESAIRLVYVPA